MKASELRKKTEKELQKLLIENREKIRKLRFDLASGKVKNVRESREARKVVARILTILNEKKKK